jgi:hypothetical protein
LVNKNFDNIKMLHGSTVKINVKLVFGLLTSTKKLPRCVQRSCSVVFLSVPPAGWSLPSLTGTARYKDFPLVQHRIEAGRCSQTDKGETKAIRM